MRPLSIAITTGDVDGIGTEIAAKALAKLRASKKVRFILWRSPQCPTSHLSKIDSNYKRVSFNNWPEALKYSHDNYKEIIDICSDLSPAHWVETSAKAAHYGHIDAIVTAPLSKTVIHSSGMTDIGHTDILKRVSGSKDVFMGFWGEKMNVVLATGHIPIQKVSEELTSARLTRAIRAAHSLIASLDPKEKRPLGILGLNPHAGESGIIGEEEQKIISTTIKKLSKEGFQLSEALVPDVAFAEPYRKKYSGFVACYHDQGLIPFKMLHNENRGVHLSLGLPFIRTSVDHGTAKDIFNKNKANYYSMLEALKLAIKLATNKSSLQLLQNK